MNTKMEMLCRRTFEQVFGGAEDKGQTGYSRRKTPQQKGKRKPKQKQKQKPSKKEEKEEEEEEEED